MTPTQYTESERERAVRAYVTQGTLRAAEEATQIPWQTIAGWKHRDPQWWDQAVAKVTLSLIEQLTESDQSSLRRVRTRVIEMLEQRLAQGDQKLNVKTGELVRVEVPAKELAGILNAVGGSIQDVAPQEQPKSSEERLAELAALGVEDQRAN